MRGDLERRLALIERGARELRSGIAVAAVEIRQTRTAIIARVPAEGGSPPGPTGIQVPCCPGLYLPETLRMRAPDGTVGNLTHNGSAWAGTLQIPMTVFPYFNYQGSNCYCLPAAGGASVVAHPVAFTLACGGSPARWLLSASATMGRTVTFQPFGSPLIGGFAPTTRGFGSGCESAPWGFSPTTPSPGGCSPFNLALRILQVNSLYVPFATGESFVVYAL